MQPFHGQLYHGIDTHGLAGAWLSDALNTNNHTYEVAPVFIVVEKALLRLIGEVHVLIKGYCILRLG